MGADVDSFSGLQADELIACKRIVELLESVEFDSELFRLRLLYPRSWGAAINRVNGDGWMRARGITRIVEGK